MKEYIWGLLREQNLQTQLNHKMWVDMKVESKYALDNSGYSSNKDKVKREYKRKGRWDAFMLFYSVNSVEGKELMNLIFDPESVKLSWAMWQ